MSDIKTWSERCEVHPDHQSGMVSHAMIQMRMQEEIDDLRAENKRLRAKISAGPDETEWSLFMAKVLKDVRDLRAENERLRAALESIVEVCVGAVDYKVKTFAEIYQRNLLHQVHTKASTTLKGDNE